MANAIGIRLNNIEEERVLGAMLAAGDENVSTHIKRVYFDALDRKDDYLYRISPELEQIQYLLRELQAQASDNTLAIDHASLSNAFAETTNPQQDLLLTLMSGMYRMLRQAVPAPIQRKADELINIAVIEEYLASTQHHDDDEDDASTDATTTDDTATDDTTGTTESVGERNIKPLSPYALGKLKSRQEMAARIAAHRAEVKSILWPEDDVVLTAKPMKAATPVNQKPTFTQKIKQSFSR
jgi:hypothetical protein